MVGRIPSATLALGLLALMGTAEARPRSGRADHKLDSRVSGHVFEGRRRPSPDGRLPRRRTRRAVPGTPTKVPTGPQHKVYTGRATSVSGKLAMTRVKAARWQLGGIRIADGEPAAVELDIAWGVPGADLALQCEVNTTEPNMSIALKTDGGPLQTQTFGTKGHHWVTFTIPSAPAEFGASLFATDLPGPTAGYRWLLYSCELSSL